MVLGMEEGRATQEAGAALRRCVGCFCSVRQPGPAGNSWQSSLVVDVSFSCCSSGGEAPGNLADKSVHTMPMSIIIQSRAPSMTDASCQVCSSWSLKLTPLSSSEKISLIQYNAECHALRHGQPCTGSQVAAAPSLRGSKQQGYGQGQDGRCPCPVASTPG